ncbi:dolichol-phosphate mannosyltransferase subunit 3 [Chironomus tepperi]|uniref:dolichol-phosphate mannosyltransferase subunit 3 n=1 Tax=Chironomus tepperi TaxID=113505 RepID=UPI00391F2A37
MTKLNEWVFGLSVFFGIYMALVTRRFKHEIIDENMFYIQILPIILVALLGIYAVTTVLYRTLTFNDCKEAADELQKEIVEAKKDLAKKGMKF